MIKVRHIIGNVPLVGRYVYPLYNRNSIFSKPGDYYPKAHLKPWTANDGKIVIFGLPKSGNTWLVSLFKDYFELAADNAWASKSKTGVSMLHDPISYRLLIRKDFGRGVYIMRDVRDIIVSYYHYSKTDYYKELNDPFSSPKDIEDFYYGYFKSKLIHRYDWLNHAEDHTSHGVPMVKYEDLYDAPVEVFENLLNKMGLPTDKSKIEEIIEKNELSKLKETGKKLWHKVPETHFRKGGYGGYKDEMPKHLIEAINEEFGPYLRKWGYSI